MPSPTPSTQRVQLHLVHAYKLQPREHPAVRRYLESGYRVESLQRVSDREILITLAKGDAAPAAG